MRWNFFVEGGASQRIQEYGASTKCRKIWKSHIRNPIGDIVGYMKPKL
jgi:hypothetical protein